MVMASEVNGDAAIARTATQMLSWAVQVPAKAITVSVHSRVITLSGQVRWRFEREAAASAVMHISGVHSIVNDISWSRVADDASRGQSRTTNTAGQR